MCEHRTTEGYRHGRPSTGNHSRVYGWTLALGHAQVGRVSTGTSGHGHGYFRLRTVKKNFNGHAGTAEPARAQSLFPTGLNGLYTNIK